MLAGIRAGGINRHRLPKYSLAFSDSDDSKIYKIRPLTVAGAAQVRIGCQLMDTTLLPVELQHENHTASTNAMNFSVSHLLFYFF
jgi:hypothetical protein